MNKVKNEYGQRVLAVGMQGSIERVKVEHPQLIQRLNSLHFQALGCYGCAVDEAIQLIRDAGIKSELETRSLLAASNYSEEPKGSVTDSIFYM